MAEKLNFLRKWHSLLEGEENLCIIVAETYVSLLPFSLHHCCRKLCSLSCRKLCSCNCRSQGGNIGRNLQAFVDIPPIREITPEDVEDAFLTIKEDIIDLVDGMITQMQADPEMAQLIVNKAIPDSNE